MSDPKIIAVMCLFQIEIQDNDKTSLLPVDIIREIMEFTVNKPIKMNKTLRRNIKLWFDKSDENQYARKKMIQLYGHISKWKTKYMTDMNHAFENIENMQEDISGWDVSNVISMKKMFSGCKNLSVDLSRWNTSKVQTMEGMFANSLITNYLNLSSWDVRSVTSMENMFLCCSCRFVEVGCWNTSNVRSMEGMFSKSMINTLSDISDWDTRNVITMRNMFYKVGNITFDMSSWDISSLQNANGMFYISYCLENRNLITQTKKKWISLNPNLANAVMFWCNFLDE